MPYSFFFKRKGESCLFICCCLLMFLFYQDSLKFGILDWKCMKTLLWKELFLIFFIRQNVWFFKKIQTNSYKQFLLEFENLPCNYYAGKSHWIFTCYTSLVMSVAGQKNFPSKSATVFVASRYYSTIYFGLEVFPAPHRWVSSTPFRIPFHLPVQF